MSAKRFGLEAVSQNLEFGKRGIKFISDGSSFQAKSNDELSLVEIKALDGTTDQSVITKAQLDAGLALKQGSLSIDAGSQNYLDLTGDVLSVKNLLIHDVVVDNTHLDLASYVAASYTVGNEMQEGDILILAAATDGQQRSWIHNGGTAVSVADFTRLQVDLSEAVIRAMFSAGTGISYNSATGEISVDATAAEISADSAGFTTISGANAQALFADIDDKISNTIVPAIQALETLSGMVSGSTDLGTFTGATISDNTTIKGALQELETKVEDVAGTVEGMCRKYSFAYTDGTFNLGNVIPAGKWIRKVSVQVGTPLNDIAATMQIGVSGDADYLMAASENDLQDAGLYEVGMLKKLASDTQLVVTLDAGTSTQGDGDILIEYC